jgi:hypothetical protein
MKVANREEELRAKTERMNEAVLEASVAAAAKEGRDTAGVREAWQEFQRAVDSGDRRVRQKAFRAAKKAFRRGIGPQLTRTWPIASVGASWALMAILTRDLVTQEGTVTVSDREILTRPWITVLPVPT